MSNLKFYAAIHTSGFIREVKLAEDRKQAKKILMCYWSDELKAQYKVERVNVTKLKKNKLKNTKK